MAYVVEATLYIFVSGAATYAAVVWGQHWVRERGRR